MRSLSLLVALAACLPLAPPPAGAVIEPEPILVGGLPLEPLPGEAPPPTNTCSGGSAAFLEMNNIPCDTAALGRLAA